MDLAPRTKSDLGVCRPWMCAFSQAFPPGVCFGCLVLFWWCVKILVVCQLGHAGTCMDLTEQNVT